jgi:ribosomal protein L11 methyltransferase
MPTIELAIPAPDDLHERLIAELADHDFETFVEEEGRLLAYCAARRYDGSAREEIERWLRARGVTEAPAERVVEDQDWNAQWEASVEPQRIGPFLVKPTWRDVPPAHADALVLEIDPKMSFGTGYHATTRLVLRFLPDLVTEGARVLDAGTGTGLLALAALRLGAAKAVGFDTSPWAVQNATENIHLNGLAGRFVVREGSVEVIDAEERFDLVLANINRAVLLGLLPELVARRRTSEAPVVLAGLLAGDRPAVLDAAAPLGLAPAAEASEDDAKGDTWWSVVLL